MKDLIAGFDAEKHPPSESFDVIPAGWYSAFVSDHTTKATKGGDGHYLELVWEIESGDAAGRKVWDRLNLDNPNVTAVEIAQASLSAICHAIGIIKPESADDLLGKVIEIKIAVQPAKGEYAASNVVKGYRAKESGSPKPKAGGSKKLPF